MQEQTHRRYTTQGGVGILSEQIPLSCEGALEELCQALDDSPGVLLHSGVTQPGRYQPRALGFIHPPLRCEARGREMTVTALNARGLLLLQACEAALQGLPALASMQRQGDELMLSLLPPEPLLFEEERTRQHSVFSVLRALVAHFYHPDNPRLGWYGAFGYDLVFQLEDMPQILPRPRDQRDLVLYLPDELIVMDEGQQAASRYRYDFFIGNRSTLGLPREGQVDPFRSKPAFRQGEQQEDATIAEQHESGQSVHCDHAPGEFEATVRLAQEHFARGDLFEVVPGQVFTAPCQDSPSAVFCRLRKLNPSPYAALINLGRQEYLVAASPEMFVRVKGKSVETCPISGTIARGRDALEDADNILQLLNSSKDHAELTMCTDVDRNDKARVCEPGSIHLLGRRQIELYSRLIHTVDHVTGRLRPEHDALDAFLSHAWAVTVTGAPKRAAMQFLEAHEKSARRWYGGAMGFIGFDGSLNTGLTLRTLRIAEGRAEVRAGATLLFSSSPEDEERETRLKASALLSAVQSDRTASAQVDPVQGQSEGEPVMRGKSDDQADMAVPRVLMVDHQDSFVHNLVSYFRAAGADIRTVRPAQVTQALASFDPQLLVLSPGPGRPEEAGMKEILTLARTQRLPVFGICLGLQGIVESYGGSLRQLALPVHGQASMVTVCQASALSDALPAQFRVGRYHSLVADSLPAELEVLMRSEDGEIMAIAHRSEPVAAVQFHPESILTAPAWVGERLIRNALQALSRADGSLLCAARSQSARFRKPVEAGGRT